MIQFLFPLIFLFCNGIWAKDPYFKIESGDQYSYGKEIAEKYQNQKHSRLFISTAVKFQQFQNNYTNQTYGDLLILSMLKAKMGEERFRQLINDYHVKKYGVSSELLCGRKNIKGLYESRGFKTVADFIIDNKQLTQEQANNIWNGYCNKRCIGQKEKDSNHLRIKNEYHQREQKAIELHKQQEMQRKEILELQKKQSGQAFQEIYRDNLLLSRDCKSPYQEARSQALGQTRQQGYKKYKQVHKFDEQTVGLCIAKNIDYKKLQHCAGTAMQHQLYDEVADCYKKIAHFFCQPNLSESILAQHSLDFAQQVTQATELEVVELAIALSDLAHLLADTANSIFTGVQQSVHGLVEMVADSVGTAKKLGYLLGKAMHYVAEAMQYADSESLGWSYYSQVLEQEHRYDAVYANAIIDQMQHWIKNSSGQEKITVASRLLTDSILYPRFTGMLSKTGRACCRVIAKIPELKFLKGFIDVYAEHKLATTLGDIGLNGMQDVGMSFLKHEIDTFGKSDVIKKTLKSGSRVGFKDTILNKAKNNKQLRPKRLSDAPPEVDMRCLLEKNLDTVKEAEMLAKRIRILSDRRIRYYKAEKIATNFGPTRGTSYVTEYDPVRGIVRSWMESYDHVGNVNRVHPKMINGQVIHRLHYPSTKSELEIIAQKIRGKK